MINKLDDGPLASSRWLIAAKSFTGHLPVIAYSLPSHCLANALLILKKASFWMPDAKS